MIMLNAESTDSDTLVHIDTLTWNNAAIKVIGVGAAGGNAVNVMRNSGIEEVDYLVCDNETEDEITKLLSDKTLMVLIVAGLDGADTTKEVSLIAQCARHGGILTVAIVSLPVRSEERPSGLQAVKDMERLSPLVDSLLVIDNQRLYEMYGQRPTNTSELKASNVMALAAKCLTGLTSKQNVCCVDFADLQNALRNSGCASIGIGEGHGVERARMATENALNSPLLNHIDLARAHSILLNISYGSGDNELRQNELECILDYLYSRTIGESNTDSMLLHSVSFDQNITDDTLIVTLIAPGFSTNCPSISSLT